MKQAKTILDTCSTHNMNFSFETHSNGAVAIAAKRIADGETIGFECYTRNWADSAELIFKGNNYFGLFNIDGKPALRFSLSKDLDAPGTHSIMTSWHKPEIVTDPVYIAATIMGYLQTIYTDFFIIN